MPEYRGRKSWAAAPSPASSDSLYVGSGIAPPQAGGGTRAGRALASRSLAHLSAEEPPMRPRASMAMQAGEHIRVAVRVRPLPDMEDGIIEVAGDGAIAIRKDRATGGNEFLKSQQGRIEERNFDKVFGPDASQRDVFAWSCEPLVNTAIEQGRSATVFVYGATGAGKTHTMFGGADPKQRGLIFRAIPEVFRAIDSLQASSSACSGGAGSSASDLDAETQSDTTFQVKVSFLEIYNETVRDLLQDGGGSGQCRVLEDERRGVVKVSNLVEMSVSSPEEALWYLHSGMQARTVEATAANSQSSRAHAVFSLTVESVRPFRAQGLGVLASRRSGEIRTLHSKISLIDLAGSERAALTQNSGSALKDGARINQSLLALANCIDALTAKGGIATPRKKPPYRDSKLTLMLKGSLTGEGMVAMIANVHPGRNHFEDSNNTLEYARRATSVRTSSASGRRLSRASCASLPVAEACESSSSSLPRPVASACAAVDSGSDVVGEDAVPDGASDRAAAPRATSSSSSLPPPGEQARRRRKTFSEQSALQHQRHNRPGDLEGLRLPSGPCAGHAAEHAAATSSPEDNLSEISLSSPAARSFDAAAEAQVDDWRRCGKAAADRGSERRRHTIGGLGSARPNSAEGLSQVDERSGSEGGEEGADDTFDSVPPHHDDFESCDVAEEEVSADNFREEDDQRAEEAGGDIEEEVVDCAVVEPSEALAVANDLIRRLRSEKEALDDRINAVLRERNALLEERAGLEEENAKLRQGGLEKDAHIASLLAQRRVYAGA